MLKPLLLFQSQLDPEPRSICEEMLGERQQALDVELIFRGFAQLHFGVRELLAQLIALPLIPTPKIRIATPRRMRE